MTSCQLMFPGVRSSLVFSGFGLKPPASGFQSYFYSSLKTSPSIYCRNLQSTVHTCQTPVRPLAIPSEGRYSSSHGGIPGGRTNWPDLDPLLRGSSQLWSKARSCGANVAARSQPSSLSSPKQSCPLQIGFLYLSKHMAEEGYIE